MPIDYRTLNQGFVVEGRFVALPLSMWDECLPLAPDASYITALAESPETGLIYGATCGTECHLFVTGTRGSAGGTLDLGTVPDAQRIPSLAVTGTRDGRDQLLAAVNRPTGCALVCAEVSFSRDVIQEPSFYQPSVEAMSEHDGHRWFTVSAGREGAVRLLRDDGLFRYVNASGQLEEQEKLPEDARPASPILSCGDASGLRWLDDAGRAHGVGIDATEPRRTACGSPPARDCTAICGFRNGALIAEANGTVHHADFSAGEVTEAGRTVLPDIQCMAALPDGRLYGMCGTGIGHFFRIDLGSRESHDLGAVASVIATKRYGLEFGCALTGIQGDIFFGENDRGGHLWLYMPAQRSDSLI